MTHITQAMILAAGKGTRMRPLTLTTPKPLIDVAGKPLIVWHIEALKKAGITDITVNCSWLADTLIEGLGDGSQFGVNLHWSKEDGEPLETAGGIAKALADGRLRQQPFILINGDVWTTFDFNNLTDVTLTKGQLAHLLLVDNPDHNPAGDFCLADGLVSKKNADTDEQTAYTFAGMSVIDPILLKNIATDEAYPLAPLLIEAMNDGKVTAEHISDTWVDVGTPERLANVEAFVASR